MSCTNPNCECKPGTYANLNPPRTRLTLQMPADAAERLDAVLRDPEKRAEFEAAVGASILSHEVRPTRFELFMLDGLEWQQTVAVRTDSGKYRVEITWALDRYRVSVYRRVQEPEKLVEVRHPLYARTAIETANKLVREYNRREF